MRIRALLCLGWGGLCSILPLQGVREEDPYSFSHSLQVFREGVERSAVSLVTEGPYDALLAHGARTHEGLRASMKSLWAQGGVNAFYRGGWAHGVWSTRWISRFYIADRVTTESSLLKGGALGMSDLLFYPFDRFRTLYAVEGHKLSAAQRTLSWRTWYAGYKPFVLSNTLQWMAFFEAEKWSRHNFRRWKGTAHPYEEDIYVSLWTGTTSVFLGSCFTPLRALVIQQRLDPQMAGQSIWDALKKMYRTQGLAPFKTVGGLSLASSIFNTYLTVSLMPRGNEI